MLKLLLRCGLQDSLRLRPRLKIDLQAGVRNILCCQACTAAKLVSAAEKRFSARLHAMVLQLFL